MSDCPPTRHGTYFATHRKYGWRSVVVVGFNGFRQTRCEVPKMSRSFGLEEFRAWVGPLSDPAVVAEYEDGAGI